MSAYIIIRIKIEDSAELDSYREAAAPAVQKYQGKFIARGGEVLTFEGPKETRRIVLIEFPSLQQAKTFYYSEEYQSACALREGIGEFEFIVVDGV